MGSEKVMVIFGEFSPGQFTNVANIEKYLAASIIAETYIFKPLEISR